MLTKRAQILFDEAVWHNLKNLAKDQNTSMGELIRQAVKQQYSEEEKSEKRRKAIERTLERRMIFKGKKIDYKEMINYGRKY